MVVLMNKLRNQMRWIMVIIAVAFVLSSFLMYGAGTFGGGVPAGMQADYAVAEINGTRIMISMMYEGLQMRMQGASREITPMDFQAVLEEYAIELQLAQEIQESGITIAAADLDQAMRDFIDNAFPTRETFHQHLQRTGRRQADYRQSLEHQMLRQRFVEESIGEVTISDEEAMEFYENMKALFFRQPSGYMVNFARFTSEEEADRVRALLADGLPWNEATSQVEGEEGSPYIVFVTEEPQLFSDAAFESLLSSMAQLEVGEISPVFELEMANDEFAIGVKTERVEESFRPFDEVSDTVHFLLQQQGRQEALSNFTAGLLSRARIEILDPSLFPVPGEELVLEELLLVEDEPETDEE